MNTRLRTRSIDRLDYSEFNRGKLIQSNQSELRQLLESAELSDESLRSTESALDKEIDLLRIETPMSSGETSEENRFETADQNHSSVGDRSSSPINHQSNDNLVSRMPDFKLKLPVDIKDVSTYIKVFENYVSAKSLSEEVKFEMLFNMVMSSPHVTRFSSFLTSENLENYEKLKQAVDRAIGIVPASDIDFLLKPQRVDPLRALVTAESMFANSLPDRRNYIITAIKEHIPHSLVAQLTFNPALDIKETLMQYIQSPNLINSNQPIIQPAIDRNEVRSMIESAIQATVNRVSASNSVQNNLENDGVQAENDNRYSYQNNRNNRRNNNNGNRNGRRGRIVNGMCEPHHIYKFDSYSCYPGCKYFNNRALLESDRERERVMNLQYQQYQQQYQQQQQTPMNQVPFGQFSQYTMPPPAYGSINNQRPQVNPSVNSVNGSTVIPFAISFQPQQTQLLQPQQTQQTQQNQPLN